MAELQQLTTYRVIIDPSASRLPAGYQEVEWIESKGEQYVDSGLSLPQGFKSESSVMIRSKGSSSTYLPSRYVGCHNSGAPYNRNHHSFQTTTSDGVVVEPASGGAGYYMGTRNVQKDVFFKYEVDNTTTVPTCKINGTTQSITATGGTTGAGNRSSNNIYVLAINQAGTAYVSTHIRVGYLKIWDKNDVLLRDYVPCYRTSDNKTGLFDLENGVFYPNKGTGEFYIGDAVGAKALKQVSPFRVIIEQSESRLPAEYQEVDYLQSTGTQYIDTGLSLVNGFRTTAKVVITDNPATGTIIGSSTHTDVWGDRNYVEASSNGQWLVGYGGTGYQYFGSYSINSLYEIDFCNIHNRESLKVNNTSYPIIMTGTPGTFYSGNLYMFANNGSGTAEMFGELKIYNLKVYNENDVLVRDFVPAKRKSNDELGMYDLVNNVFYTNSGSGKFLSGGISGIKTLQPLTTFKVYRPPRIPQEYQEVEWIESDGNQIIDVDYTYSNVLDARMLIDFSCLNGGSSIFNANGWSGSAFGGPNLAVSNAQKFSYAAGVNDTATTVSATSGRRYVHDLDIPNNYYKVIDTTNNSVVVDLKSLSKQSKTGSTYSGCIFGYVTTNGQRVVRAMKIYSAKFFDQGQTVRDFVPCYKKSNNEIGMYDLVSGTFFANAGTGTFTKGQNV